MYGWWGPPPTDSDEEAKTDPNWLPFGKPVPEKTERQDSPFGCIKRGGTADMSFCGRKLPQSEFFYESAEYALEHRRGTWLGVCNRCVKTIEFEARIDSHG